MDSTTLSPADRRTAHRRVGAASVAVFLLLLALGATRGPAQASTTSPARSAPAVSPNTIRPTDPDPSFQPGFRHDHDGPRGFRGGGEGSAPAPSAPAPTSPAPSTGGSQT